MRRWIQTQDITPLVRRTVSRPETDDDEDNVVQTVEQVSYHMFHAFQRHFPVSECEALLSKLTEYRLVDRVCDLHKGRYIRWIRLDDKSVPPTLHKGAVAVNVSFSDEGTCIRCKIAHCGYVQLRFDQCLVFERFTEEEQLLMAAAAAASATTA